MKPLYYRSGSSARSLKPRLNAITAEMDKDSSVMDIGCIDGTMGRHLLYNGYARQIYGMDIVDKFWEPHPDLKEPFVFIKADITKYDISSLPDVDYVLFLNVLHHIVHEDRDLAVSILDKLMSKCRVMFFDMGSFTETMTKTCWQKTFEKHWKDDQDMWDWLFDGLDAKKIFRYEQRGGTRTMFKLRRS